MHLLNHFLLFDGFHGIIATFGLTGGAFATLAAGALGAGASIYSANKASKAAQAGQRNLGDELGAILGQVPGASAAGYQNQQQYGGLYDNMRGDSLRTGLLGTPYFNADAAYNAIPADQRSGIDDEAARTGRTPQQWLHDHTLEQMGNGDALAQSGFKQFGGYSGGLADTLGGLQNQLDRSNAASSTFQRNSNMADMQNLAPQADTLRRQLNPELFASLGAVDSAAGAGIDPSQFETRFGQMALGGSTPLSLGRIGERVGGPSGLTRQMARGAMDGSTGPAALESSLYGQAADALAQGGELTAQEQRNAQAQSRAAFADRGLGDSNSALAAEVLSLDSAKRARLDSNRNFASGVDQLLRSGQASDRSFGLNLDASSLARSQLRGQLQQNNVGNQLNEANFNFNQRQADLAALGGADQMARSRGTEQFGRLTTAAGLRGSTFFDPSSVLGQVDNRLNATQALAAGQQTFQGAPDFTSAMLGYGSDLYGGNANARAAGGINSANAYASLGGGLLSAAGSLGSAQINKTGSLFG